MICTRTLKNGKKRYFARLTDPATGRKVTSRRFNRRRDAEAEETAMKVRLFRGEPLKLKDDRLYGEFSAELRSRCTASERTRRDYERIDEWFARTLSGPLRRITTEDCEDAVARLAEDKAPNTVDKYVVRMRHVFKRAAAYGYIQASPADDISNKPKVITKRRIQTLQADEVKKLLEIVDPYWRPLFMLWLVTGMRRSEIFGLTTDCLDRENARVHVRQQLTDEQEIKPATKNHRPRTIPVDETILAAVLEHAAHVPHVHGYEDLVFPSRGGTPVHYSDWNRDVFKPLAKSLGRPTMVTHDIRHTFASQALSRGVNIKTLQMLLGHADASLTLNRYSHLIPSDALVAAQKMADLLLREEVGTRIGHASRSWLFVDEVA